MQINKVRVDGQMFILQPEQDVDALQSEIVDAARAGGDFVSFNTGGRYSMSVLITAGVVVRFEVIDMPEEQVNEWEERPPNIEPNEEQYDELLTWEY